MPARKGGQSRRTITPARPVRRAPPPPRKSLSLSTIIGATILVVAIGAAVVAVSLYRSSGDSKANERATAISSAITAIRSVPAEGFTLGNAAAPLQLELFEDFQCPFCVEFTSTDESVLVDEYVKLGKLRLTFNNYPILGAESVLAATASVCAADQGRAWPYGLELFRQQAQAGQVEQERLNVGRFTTQSLTSTAVGLGLDEATFSRCLSSSEALAKVQAQNERGRSLGVTGTPSFALNGKPIQTPGNAAGWRTVLNAALAAVSP